MKADLEICRSANPSFLQAGRGGSSLALGGRLQVRDMVRWCMRVYHVCACWRVPPASFSGARVRACVLCVGVCACRAHAQGIRTHAQTTQTSTHARMRTHACTRMTGHTSWFVRVRTHDKIVVHYYLYRRLIRQGTRQHQDEPQQDGVL